MLSVGAMKAGTSWLFELLKDHPDLSTVPIKEIHYLWDRHGSFRMLTLEQRKATVRFHIGALLASSDGEAARALLRWCERFLREPVDDRWFADLFEERGPTVTCAEFSNMNALLDAEGWRHARSLGETLRIVYILRNPLERLWSHASFHASLTGRARDLPAFSQAEFERFMEEAGCFRHGQYAGVIGNLRANLDDHEWRVFRHDDMRSRPADLLRDVERFVGIAVRDVAPEKLAHVHSATERKGEMPASFRHAARPYVEAEIEALLNQGTAVPDAWVEAPTRDRTASREAMVSG